MGFQTRKNAAGLLNNVNKFTSATPYNTSMMGALSVADNIIINADNEISKRQGFDSCSIGLPAAVPQKLFVHNGVLYLHINNHLYFKDDACTWNIVRGLVPTLEPLWIAMLPVSVPFLGSVKDLFFTSSDTVRDFNNPNQTVSTLAGIFNTPGNVNGTGSTVRFNQPEGICLDSTLLAPIYLLICDVSNHQIKQLTLSTGVVATFAGTGVDGSADGPFLAATFDQTFGIASESFINLAWVSEFAMQTIRELNFIGSDVITRAGSVGVVGYVDGAGANARFHNPVGINYYLPGDNNNLYICDSLNYRIRTMDVFSYNVATFAGNGVPANIDGIGTAASFAEPWGIWGDATDLYVTDIAANTIRKIHRATKQVTTFAGIPFVTGTTDGAGATATFNSPYGISGDDTFLYVCDLNNFTIRRINKSTAFVETIAGIPGIPGGKDGSLQASSFQGPT